MLLFVTTLTPINRDGTYNGRLSCIHNSERERGDEEDVIIIIVKKSSSLLPVTFGINFVCTMLRGEVVGEEQVGVVVA